MGKKNFQSILCSPPTRELDEFYCVFQRFSYSTVLTILAHRLNTLPHQKVTIYREALYVVRLREAMGNYEYQLPEPSWPWPSRYSHCGSDFIFASVLCKIIDVMTPFSEVECYDIFLSI